MASSIHRPATPVAMQRVTLSATSSGASPYPDMKSALTGKTDGRRDVRDIGKIPIARDDDVVARIREAL